MKKLFFALYIVFLGLFACNQSNQPPLIFSIKTDSTKYYINDRGGKTFLYYIEETISELAFDDNNDTIYLKRYLTPDHYEKLEYKNNKLFKAALYSKPNKYIYLVSLLRIENNSILKDSSQYFTFRAKNDSIFLKPHFAFSAFDKILTNVDSITIFKNAEFYVPFGNFESLEFRQGSKKLDNWFYFKRSNSVDSVMTILTHFYPDKNDPVYKENPEFLNDPEGVKGSNIIYMTTIAKDWNEDFFKRYKTK